MKNTNFTLESDPEQIPRAGILHTTKGDIPTPYFMPVGTRASVKGLSQEVLEQLDFPLILANTYHLLLRPGHTIVENGFGSLHNFMSWPGAILTDSGGFQVYSLSTLNKITNEGVYFQSPIDGTKHFLTPESSMEIQKSLGSDVVMAFDECLALPATDKEIRISMERSLRWAKRCRDVHLKAHQQLFGIVQGGLNIDFRLECLDRLVEMNFDGYALGGLSVGESPQELRTVVSAVAHKMPKNKIRYLMGVGTPLDILDAIKAGIDLFDCVMPTRNARNGQAFTTYGKINVKNSQFISSKQPIDSECACSVCQRYTLGYIRHLIMVKEYLGGQLLSMHNLFFYRKLVRLARIAILNGTFDEYYQRFYKDYLRSTKHE